MLGQPIQFKAQEINHSPGARTVYTTPYWYSWVRRISGRGGADIRQGAQPIPGADGQRQTGDSLFGGKPMTFTGVARGKDMASLYTGLAAMKAVFDDLTPGNLEYYDYALAARKVIVCRVTQAFDWSEEITARKYEYEWTVQLTADDPFAVTDP